MTTLSRLLGPYKGVPACRAVLLGLLWLASPVLTGHEALAQLAPALAEDKFSDAFALYTQRLYEPALQAFSGFYEAFPDHVSAPDALYYQAEIALVLGREEEAIRLFRTFQQRYPEHPLAFQARLALGKYFYETGNYQRALATLQQVVDDGAPPETAAKALYWMGESALNLNREGEAIGYFQRAADQYRQTDTAPVALYAIAFTEVRRGNYDAAARAFELLAARHPDSPYAQDIGLALAEVYYELGDYARAASEVQLRLPNLRGEALERATFLLAESYNQLRDSANAIVYYRRITEGSPQSPYYRRALFGLAWNYHFEGAYQWAAEQFELAARDQDDDLAGSATYYQGVNRKLAQEPDEAARLFRETVTRWPGHALAAHALFELGTTYYEQRRWAEANEAFNELVENYRSSELFGEALNMQGNTYIALNNFDAALRSFEQAIANDAASPALKEEIVFQKAWLLYRNGNYDQAVTAFTNLYNGNPRGERGDESLFWAAESVYQTGDLLGAHERFTQYLRTFPNGKHVDATHYALGWVYFKQSRYQQAIDAFERFLDAYRNETDYVPYRTDALLRLADSHYALKQ